LFQYTLYQRVCWNKDLSNLDSPQSYFSGSFLELCQLQHEQWYGLVNCYCFKQVLAPNGAQAQSSINSFVSRSGGF